MEASLAPGECQQFRLSRRLAPGAALCFVLEQRAIDVTVRLRLSAATDPVEFDSPTASTGVERGVVVADRRVSPLLWVCAPKSAERAGDYVLETAVVEPATRVERIGAEAHARYRLGRTRQREGDLTAAAAAFTEAGRLWRSIDDRFGQAWVAVKLGGLALERKDPAAALGRFETAADLYHQLGQDSDERRLLITLGNVLRRMGRSSEALARYRTSLTSAREHQDHPAELVALNNIAVILGERGDSKGALATYFKLRQAWHRAGDVENEVKVLSSMGSVYLNLGEPERAAAAFAEAESLAGTLDDPEVQANLLEQEGRTFLAKERLPEALKALERALDLQADSPRRSLTLNNLGRVLLQLGRTREAEARLSEGLRTARESKWWAQEATIHLNLAKARLEGDPERALEHCRAGLDLFRGEAEDLNGEAAAEYCAALALRGLGKLKAAKDRVSRSLEIVETLRRRTLHPAQRASYLATRRKYLDLCVSLEYDLGGDDPSQELVLEAFLAAEAGRARTLSESVAGSREESRRGWGRLREQIKAVAGRRSRTDDAEETERFDAILDSLLERYRMLAAELSQPDEETLAPLTASDLEAFRSQLDAGTQVVAYYVGADRSFVWLLDARRAVMKELPVDSGRLERQARWIHEQIQTGAVLPTQLDLALETLAAWILAPIEDELHGDRLILILDGALHYVPFAALPFGDSGKHLVDRFELTRLPSVATFLRLETRQAERAAPTRRLAVFADPVFRRDDPRLGEGGPRPSAPFVSLTTSALRSWLDGVSIRLPGTRREALAIAALVPRPERSVFLDAAADRENLFSAAVADASILHLATHAFAHPEQPELSGVLLSMFDRRGAPADGFVRAFELGELELSADLVVLSACRTAIGRDVVGEGPLGLTRSFLGVGVPRVVVSLWRVDDEATSDLMIAFYRGLLLQGLSPSAALAAAQRSTSRDERWGAPYYWAGFTVQGDWR